MFYKLINYPLVVGLCALGIFLFRKMKIKKKSVISVLSVLWCVLILFLISVFPIENVFVTFDSPERVVSYTKGLNSINVIDGESSCVVVSKKDSNTYTNTFVLKKDDGYKIAYYFSVQLLYREPNSHGSITVYKVRDTQDYYLEYFAGRAVGEIEIYNQNGERVDCEIHNTNSPSVWVYLNDFSDDYYMVLNGERVDF